MIYQVYSSTRANDFYYIDLSNDTWSGWRQGKRFKDLTKHPYSRLTNAAYRGDVDAFLKTVETSRLLSKCTYLGSSIEDVQSAYPELFI